MEHVTVLIEGAGLEARAIDVSWRGRRKAIATAAQARIDARWNHYLAEARAAGQTLFNGPIACLAGAAVRRGRVALHLEAGDYKSFLVTVLRDRAWFLEHAPQALAPALGNSVLMTRHREALLGIRSTQVSAYAGRAHLIGGVLEELGTSACPASAEGIIAHLRREMAEEAGIVDGDLQGAPKLLAVVRDDFLGQPELIWQWELATPIEQIGKRLAAAEHSGWLAITDANESGHRARMTPVARAAWQRSRNRI